MLWAMDEIIHKKVPELATMILKIKYINDLTHTF